jgi:PPOX class probable F420-dependent enzyme
MAKKQTASLLPEPNRDLLDGACIRISRTKDRQKFGNLTGEPHVARSITDPDNPYRYLEVRGVVDKVDGDPERGFIDGLSERYLGQRPYPMHRRGDERVIVYVRPTDGSAMAAWAAADNVPAGSTDNPERS